MDDISRILDEKRQIIRKTGLLEYYQHTEALTAVGWGGLTGGFSGGGRAPLNNVRQSLFFAFQGD